MGKKKLLAAAGICLAVFLLAGVGMFLYQRIVPDTQVLLARQLEAGQRYLLEENYEEAKIAFQKVLELEPRQMEAYLGLAKAYEEDGDEEQALLVLREAQWELEASYDPEEEAFGEAEEVLSYMLGLYERQEQIEEAGRVQELFAAVQEKDPDRVRAIAEGETSQITAFQLYQVFSPLLNWNMVDMQHPDIPVLYSMNEPGNRKTFANLCFIYAEEMFHGFGLENQAGQYEAYNRIFERGDTNSITYDWETEEFFFVDYDILESEVSQDWTAELEIPYQDFEFTFGQEVPDTQGILDAYRLEELNLACQALFGSDFQPFTPEELQVYNFYYDKAHGIACRRSWTGDRIDETYYYLMHNYVRDIRQKGTEIEFTIDHCRMESPRAERSNYDAEWHDCYRREEIADLLEEISDADVLFNSIPVVLDGIPVPVLNAVVSGFSKIESANYKISLQFTDVERDEWTWDMEEQKLKRAMSEEEVFTVLQDNVETLWREEQWNDYYSVPYSVHFKVRVDEEGFEILSVEMEERDAAMR